MGFHTFLSAFLNFIFSFLPQVWSTIFILTAVVDGCGRTDNAIGFIEQLVSVRYGALFASGMVPNSTAAWDTSEICTVARLDV